MANLVKPKIGVSIFSVSVLVLVLLLETNFFAPVTIKKWSVLSWDDFQGLPQPFSSYEAAISSRVYLEYDSLFSTYLAYAGQNNVQSWARRSRPHQTYELNHEQYHFNITEIHARKLNKYIQTSSRKSEYAYRLRLESINIDLNRMQDQYDEETDHGLLYDKQMWWEHRIDSLLELEEGWVTDLYSGAQAYFPQKPDSLNGFTDSSSAYRGYELKKYNMRLAMVSFQMEGLEAADLKKNIYTFYTNDIKKLKAVSFDSSEYSFKAFVISEDTSRYTYYNLWLYNDPYLFKVYAQFPNNTGDTTGYAQIASSFINSFTIINTNYYWITQAEKFQESNQDDHDDRYKGAEDEAASPCLKFGLPYTKGFYRGPFFRHDGALLLAYDYIVHADTLRHQDIILVDSEVHSFAPTAAGRIYFIPKEKLPDKTYYLDFGYTLKEDSIKTCYGFYRESLRITPTDTVPTISHM